MMKINPLHAFTVPAIAFGIFVRWRVFHHDVSDLAAVDKQPTGRYFLLLKGGAGQHDAAIVVKTADGKQSELPGVAKGASTAPSVIND